MFACFVEHFPIRPENILTTQPTPPNPLSPTFSLPPIPLTHLLTPNLNMSRDLAAIRDYNAPGRDSTPLAPRRPRRPVVVMENRKVVRPAPILIPTRRAVRPSIVTATNRRMNAPVSPVMSPLDLNHHSEPPSPVQSLPAANSRRMDYSPETPDSPVPASQPPPLPVEGVIESPMRPYKYCVRDDKVTCEFLHNVPGWTATVNEAVAGIKLPRRTVRITPENYARSHMRVIFAGMMTIYSASMCISYALTQIVRGESLGDIRSRLSHAMDRIMPGLHHLPASLLPPLGGTEPWLLEYTEYQLRGEPKMYTGVHPLSVGVVQSCARRLYDSTETLIDVLSTKPCAEFLQYPRMFLMRHCSEVFACVHTLAVETSRVMHAISCASVRESTRPSIVRSAGHVHGDACYWPIPERLPDLPVPVADAYAAGVKTCTGRTARDVHRAQLIPSPALFAFELYSTTARILSNGSHAREFGARTIGDLRSLTQVSVPLISALYDLE